MFGQSSGEPPLIFFLLLIIFGVILTIGGMGRWPYLQRSGYLPRLLKSFFLFSTEETNDYITAFYLIGGIISIITGLIGVFIILN